MNATSLENPYADYDAAKLYAFLSTYQLSRDPGTQWEYLESRGRAAWPRAGAAGGHGLRAAGEDARILEPLAMRHTTITLTTEVRGRLATPHDESLRPVGIWDLNALAGAGALRSTAEDF